MTSTMSVTQIQAICNTLHPSIKLQWEPLEHGRNWPQQYDTKLDRNSPVNSVSSRISTNSAGSNSRSKSKSPNCSRCSNHGKIVPVKGHKKICSRKNCPCFACGLVDERKSVIKKQKEAKVRQTEVKRKKVYSYLEPSFSINGRKWDEIRFSEEYISVLKDEALRNTWIKQMNWEAVTYYFLTQSENQFLTSKEYYELVINRMVTRTAEYRALEFFKHGNTIDLSTKKGKHAKKKRYPICSQCDNHSFKVDVKNHKEKCPYTDCRCEMCILTVWKKHVMKTQVAWSRHQRTHKIDKVPFPEKKYKRKPLYPNIAEELFAGENKKSVVELISKNYNDAEKLAIFMAIYEQVDGRRDAMDSFIRECEKSWCETQGLLTTNVAFPSLPKPVPTPSLQRNRMTQYIHCPLFDFYSLIRSNPWKNEHDFYLETKSEITLNPLLMGH